MSIERGTKSARGSEARRSAKPAAAQQASMVDPMRVIRQSLGLMMIMGVVGLILGVGVFFGWDRFFPQYKGAVIFELAAELSASDETAAREDRNEDTIRRLAQTEAQKAVSEEVLVKVLRLKDVQRTQWGAQFMDASGNFLSDKAYTDLDDSISAGYVNNTQFFRISWTAKSAADIPVVLNSIADTYFDQRMVARANVLNSVRSVFGSQKDILIDDIALAQTEIDDFIKIHDITTLDQGSLALSKDLEDTTMNLNGTTTQLQMARTQQRQVQSKLLGRLEPSQDDILLAQQDPLVRQAEQVVLGMKRELAHARQRFSSEHPHVKSVESQLFAATKTKEEKVDEVVQRDLSGSLKTLNNQIESLAALEESLIEEIDAMAVRLEEFTSYYQDLEQKQKIVERLQERLNGLEQTQLEIQAMKDRSDAEKVVLVAPATKPRTKSWPKWYVVIPGTAMFTLGLTISIVFLREFLDKRLRYASDVLSLPGGRLLGMVPDLQDDPSGAARVEMVVRDYPSSIVAESYRQCYSSLAQPFSTYDISSVLIVGGMPESGSSSMASNLALTAAASGQRVALVDANFRRPRIADLFGIDSAEPGFGEVLSGEASLQEVLHETQEGFFVVAAGGTESLIVERLSTSNFSTAIADLKKSVDVVFIDAPPLVVAGESLTMAGQVDATVLVARAYAEQKGLVARLIHQLSEQRSDFMGVILNRPRTTAGGYFRENFKAMAGYAARSDAVEGEAAA